jgi:biotin carboxyl carrier protein
MKLTAELGKKKHELQIRQADGRVFANIDGRQYELEAAEVEPNVWLFKHEGRVFECHVNSDGTISVQSQEFNVKLHDPKRLRGVDAGEAQSEGRAEIKTAMPGKIVRILAQTGAEVAAGDGVIVVEAMKMQNEMKSPKDGIVKEIRFAEGDTVNAGDMLVVIE